MGRIFGFSHPALSRCSQIFVSNRFWCTAGAFSNDDHLFQTSSWHVPCVLRAPLRPPCPVPRPRHTQNQPFKITLLYEFRQPFGSAEMFQFFLGRQLFLETVSKAPLSPRVFDIEGQTNTLSDPPLHEGHSNAIYLGIERCLG